MLVICLLTASLDVSSLELKKSVKSASATSKTAHYCLWVYLTMSVIFAVWIYYTIICEELLVISQYFVIKKVFPSLMFVYSLIYFLSSFFDSSD
ncbi:hypothetical protein IKI14_00825 [bacterium]|nr:hypothetical protein [bacterium]